MYPVLFLIQFIIDRTFLNRKRMTHGNQFRCFFHAHDSSHPRHAKDIAFFDISLRNACHDLRTYRNISGCQCSPIVTFFPETSTITAFPSLSKCVSPFSMAFSSLKSYADYFGRMSNLTSDCYLQYQLSTVYP